MNPIELQVMIERLLALELFAYELRASSSGVDYDHFTRMAVWLGHAASVIDAARIAEAERLGVAYMVIFEKESRYEL